MPDLAVDPQRALPPPAADNGHGPTEKLKALQSRFWTMERRNASQGSSHLVGAFSNALTHPVDARALIVLHGTVGEVRYEELRRAVAAGQGPISPQPFKDSVDRLIATACVNRRLEPLGESRFASFLSLTPRGVRVARLLLDLAASVEAGRVGPALPERARQGIGNLLRGRPASA